MTSANVTAVSGYFSEATRTTVFPPEMAGISKETNPRSGLFSGAIIPTTPVASATEKLK
jgi:hypothetical protein